MGMNDMNSLSHTRWNCKYHIVFAPKYRRKVFYKEKRTAIGKILRQLCEWKGVKIIEAEACPNHIHLYVEIPPKISVSHFMHLLKYIKALRLTDNSCLRPERWIVLPYLTVTVFSAGLRVMVYSPGATRMLSPFSVPNQYSFATLPPQP